MSDQARQRRPLNALALDAPVFITLRAKTPRGEATVKKHGALWHVCEEAASIQFSAKPGPWLLLETRGDMRWVHVEDDTDVVAEPFEALEPQKEERLRRELVYSPPSPDVPKHFRGGRERRKSPALAAVLSLFFGPLGYLYVGWRYGVMAVGVFVLFVLVLSVADFPLPRWMKYVILPVLAWKAFTVCSVRNTLIETNDDNVKTLNTLPIAAMAMSDLLVGIGIVYAGAAGLYASGVLLVAGSIVKGLAMLLMGTPLLVWIASMVFGLIAVGIDAAFARQAENVFRR